MAYFSYFRPKELCLEPKKSHCANGGGLGGGQPDDRGQNGRGGGHLEVLSGLWHIYFRGDVFELRKLSFDSLRTEIKVSAPAGREPEWWQEERGTEGGTSRKGESELWIGKGKFWIRLCSKSWRYDGYLVWLWRSEKLKLGRESWALYRESWGTTTWAASPLGAWVAWRHTVHADLGRS